MTTTRPMLNIDEAAVALGITARTLQRLARRGAVPGAKVGGEWRFPANVADVMVERESRAAAQRAAPEFATVTAGS